jgi:hypothetical protein
MIALENVRKIISVEISLNKEVLDSIDLGYIQEELYLLEVTSFPWLMLVL